jgi:hypothetical protein
VRSLQHQWLLLWVARKMERDGFRLTGYDGPTPQGGDRNALPLPPCVGGFRPDAFGVAEAPQRLAIGEAKTREDVDTLHTRHQLRAFHSVRCRATGACARLYVAAPQSAAGALDLVLTDAGLFGSPDVVRVLIPDCLLGENTLAVA